MKIPFIDNLKKDWEQTTRGGQTASWRKFLLYSFMGLNQGWAFLFWFRLSQSPFPVIALPARVVHKFYVVITKMAISYHTQIDGGLHLGDCMCMVINPKTKIGKNCHLSQFLNIGTNTDSPAIIGDNVYIGPNVCIDEGVKIGNYVTIGAGSVVTKDIPDNATVAGVPAKILNFNNPARFIWNPTI